MFVSFNQAPLTPLDAARAALQAGRVHEAESLLRDLLQREPHNPDALHLLGILCYRTRRPEEGLRLLRAAIDHAPTHAFALRDLGEILRVQGDLPEAEALCRRALSAAPTSETPAALAGLAKVLAERGNLEEAAALARQASTLAPGDPAFHAVAGRILFHLGRRLEAARAADPDQAPAQRTDLATYLDAARHLEEAVRRDPQHAANCVQLALAYERVELYDRAYHVHKHAVELRPADVDTVLSMAFMLTRLQWLEEAELFTRMALALDAAHGPARENLAAVLLTRGKYAEALALSRWLHAEAPDNLHRVTALADALTRVGQFEDALALLESALANPAASASAAALWQALSNAHLRRGDPEAALPAVEQAIALDPQNIQLPFNKGIVLATLGRLAEAWPLLEYRWRNPVVTGRARHLAAPRWDGRPLAGGRVVLLAEQGLGDTVQFARFAQAVRERGGQPVLWCPAPLVSLMKTLPGIAEVIAEGPNLAGMQAEAWLPLMSLPSVLGTTLESLPRDVPYLRAEPDKAARWREELRAYDGLKVGLVWECGPAHPERALRSLPLEAFSPLAAVPGVTFFGLQKGAAPQPPTGMRFVNLGDRLTDLAETAAILENLDLLISVDTAVVHVAGALARPVWALLALHTGHLWMTGREDSPWYSTVRLFRQPSFGDWPTVIARLVEELQRLTSNR